MKVMVIDGNSIVNRAFYGVRPLTTRDGLYTNAVYGFLSIYLKLMEEEKPDSVCVAFDLRAPTFRHKRYEGYKAQRKGMPEELAMQMEPLKELLDAMNVCRIECEGYEADDIIGTISRMCAEGGDTCTVVTGDRDSFQLIANQGTEVLLVSSRMGKTETVRYDRAAIYEKYGLFPEQMRDLKGLQGDASDNIPGVKGIGEKTAIGLLKEFENLDNLYERLEGSDLRQSVKDKLIADREMAFLSRELATICLTAPITFDCGCATCREYNKDALYRILSRLEFQKYIAKFGLTPPADSAEMPAQTKEFRAFAGSVEELIDAVCAADLVAVYASSEFDGIALAWGEQFTALCMSEEGEFATLLQIVFSNRVRKVCHDVRSLMVKLHREGICFGGFAFDTALAAYLIEPSSGKYPLDAVVAEHAPEYSVDESVLLADDAFAPLGDLSAAKQMMGLCAQAILTMQERLESALSDRGLNTVYYDIELPLAEMLAELQVLGVRVDRAALLALSESLHARIETIANEIYAAAGEEFNILSPKQLGVILFEKLGLPPVKKTKSGYSTDIDVLEKLSSQHPIVPLLIEYRKCTKLKSTYADGLAKEISQKDGRIHGSFHQMTTATGRISSVEPNLQNIPVRSEMGGEVRKMFVPKDGCVLIDADYSQIELRILAHISGDPVMQRAFNEELDIHTATAAQIFSVSNEDVTSEMRRAAKAVNFGIVYGMSEHSLAEDLGVGYYEAKRYMEHYFNRYSGVHTYMQSIVEQAKRDGFVTTLLGRRRNIPELFSKNYNLRAFGERVALNAPIRGTAADIMKLAMLGVRKALADAGLSSRVILQVHDELLVEAPKEEAERVLEIVKREMECAYTLDVPLTVDANVGETWYDAKS